MKKVYLTAIAMLVLLTISACGGTSTNVDVPANKSGASNGNGGEAEVVKEEPTKAPEEQPTEAPEVPEAPEDPSYAPGDKFTIGDWEIVLDSFEFNQKVSDDYFSSSADEGNKFIVLNYTVTNKGKEASTFTNMFGGINMKAIFQEEYEYNYTVTMIDGDMSNGSVKPLSSKTGFVVIEVPDLVADSEESLVVFIGDKSEKAQVTLR